MGCVLSERAPSAAVAELDGARAAFRRACEREEGIERGDADAELGIADASAKLDAAQARRDELMRRLARGDAIGPEAMAEARAAIREAEAGIREAEASLESRRELLAFAQAETARARERLDRALRAAIRTEDALLNAKMRELDAEAEAITRARTPLLSLSTRVREVLNNPYGPRAEVGQLGSFLAEMEAAR